MNSRWLFFGRAASFFVSHPRAPSLGALREDIELRFRLQAGSPNFRPGELRLPPRTTNERNFSAIPVFVREIPGGPAATIQRVLLSPVGVPGPAGKESRPVTRWVVVNRTAGSGRAENVGQRLVAELPDAVLKPTTGPGDATRIARDARREGVDTLVAVGGDGTIHECVAGLALDEQGAPTTSTTRLAICPAGTGGDFRKTFGFKDSLEHAIARICDPHPVGIDVGRATFENNGVTRHTAFANVLSFGLGGLTDQLVNNGPKWLGGRAAFFLGAVRANLAHTPIPIELRLDDDLVEIAPFSNVAVCSGRFFGGGMRIAPDADPSDGYFDVITMELSKAATLTLAAAIYRGTHLKRAGVKHYRCKTLEATPTRPGECLLDVDGEQLGVLPLKVELLPQAISLLT
jgi:diacylglycerol kinase (ATP)